MINNGVSYSNCPRPTKLVTCETATAANFDSWPNNSWVDVGLTYESGNRNEMIPTALGLSDYSNNRCIARSGIYNGVIYARSRNQAICY